MATAIGVPWLISAYSVAWPGRRRPCRTPQWTAGRGRAPKRPGAAAPGNDRRGWPADRRVQRVGPEPTPGRVAPFIAASGADVAVLIELRPPLAARLADDPLWPYLPAPREDELGKVYVRRDAEARDCASRTRPPRCCCRTTSAAVRTRAPTCTGPADRRRSWPPTCRRRSARR
ncbi:MAG: hypothetical protein U0470_11700 [Anaerolineae bacterium]